MAVLGTVNAMACVPVVRFGPEQQSTVWSQYLGAAAHDASATEHFDGPPTFRWRTHVGRAVRGAPAISESVLAFGTTERTVVLLGRDSGQVLWEHRVAGTIRGGPLLSHDRVYVATEESPSGRVYALALRTGKVLWDMKTGSVEAPLTLADGRLIAGSESGTVMAFTPDTGGELWRRRLSGAIRVAPVPTLAGVVVATTSDTLYLLDPATGSIRRRLALPGVVLGTPAADSTHVYVGTTSGMLLAITTATFSVDWSVDVGDAVYGAPALARDTLFALSRGGRLVVVPLATPNSPTRSELGLITTAGPTPLANGILVAGANGEVRYVDSATGIERWHLSLTGPVEQPPLVRDGQLVIVGDRGQIVTYR